MLGCRSSSAGLPSHGTRRRVGARDRRSCSCRRAGGPRDRGSRRSTGRSRLPCSTVRPRRRSVTWSSFCGAGKPGRRVPDRCEDDACSSHPRCSQATTIWPAAFDAAMVCQSAVVAAGPTTPRRRPAGSAAARVAKRIVWVPEPQPGPAHCVHETRALPVASIEANGVAPVARQVARDARPETSPRTPPGAVLGGADDALAADRLGPRLDREPAVGDRDRRPERDGVARARERRRGPTTSARRRPEPQGPARAHRRARPCG